MADSPVVKKIPRHTYVRWSLAATLVIGGIVVTLISNTTHALRVCEDVASQTGSQVSFYTCRPLGFTDAPIVLSLLLFVLLIIPDFTRVSILGFIELERKVGQQEEKTKALETQLIAIQAVQAAASATAIHTDTLYLQAGEDPGVALSRIDQKRDQFNG